MIILFFTLALLVAVLIFVGYPLLQSGVPREVEAIPPSLGQREQLVSQREHALSTLKELEFEHSIGNLSDADYAALHGAHRHKAVAIMRELDSLEITADAAPAPVVDDSTLDARLEDDIARARQRLTGHGPGSALLEGEAEGEASQPLCPACGASHAARARFCAECGRPLTDAAEGPARGPRGTSEA